MHGTCVPALLQLEYSWGETDDIGLEGDRNTRRKKRKLLPTVIMIVRIYESDYPRFLKVRVAAG